MKDILKRLQSPVTITAILSVVLLLFTDFDNTTMETIKQSALTILVAFGILNNPSNKVNF